MGTGAVELVHDGVTTDITDLIDRTRSRIEYQANPLNGVATIVIRDEDGTLAIRERDEILVYDDAVLVYGSEIATLDPDTDDAPAIEYTAKCQSFDSLLEQRVIPYEAASIRDGAGRYDDDDVTWIISFGADLGLSAASFVSRLRTDPLGTLDYRGKTLKAALSLLGQETTGVTSWVDHDKEIHWTDPQSAQKVSNEDFEDGGTNWAVDAAASVDADGGPGGTGDAALVTVGDGSGRHETTQTVTGITGDRRYFLSADVEGADATVRFDWQDAGSVSQRIDTLTSGDAAWNRVRAIVTAPASATKVIVRLGGTNNFSTTVGHDNVNVIGEDAAFGVSTSPDGTTTRRFWGFKRPTDATSPINKVLVIGNGITDWRTHAGSVAYYGGRVFEGVLEDDRVTTADGIDSRAAYVFRKAAYPTHSGSYETDQSGLQPGTFQIVENEVLGLEAIEWIATVRTTFEGNGHLLYRVTIGSPEEDMGSVLVAVGSAFDGSSSDVGVADPAIPGSDSTAPAVPTGLAVSSGTTQATDGTHRPYLLTTWDAVADVDLNAYEVEVDRAIDGEITFVASASGVGGSLPAGNYAVQVTGVGDEGGETAVISDPQVVAIAAGDRLYVNITPKTGIASFVVYASILAGAETQPQQATTTATTGSDVEITAAGAGAVYPPATSTAIAFINPTASRTSAVSHYTEAITGGVYYASRVRAIDHSGNASDWTATEGILAGDDTLAPSIPAGVTLSTGYRIIGVRWSRPADRDIAFYQVRWTPEDTGTPGTPDATAWDKVTALTNWVTITDLDAGSTDGTTPPTTYFVQVRAIDRSGNVRTSDADPTAVDADENPEAGWSNTGGVDDPYISAEPVLLSGQTDVAYGTIVADHIAAEGLDAGTIRAGTLSLGGLPGTPDVLIVYDVDGDEIGRWDENGLVLTDPTNPDLVLRVLDGALEFSEDGGSTWTTALSAQGIRADAITLGTAPGGHNAVPNSSFELAAFATNIEKVWTVAADWGTTIGTDVNVTKSGSSLALTDVTY